MKQISGYLVFILFLTGVCSAQDNGRVIFYRENNIAAAAVSYDVFANNVFAARLKNGSYSVFNCPAGNYTFRVENFGNTAVTMKVEKEKTYYLRLGLKTGMWTVVPELIAVDSVSAYPAIKSGMLKYMDMNTSGAGKLNRFGINTFLGFGFKSVVLFTTTGGDDSKLSFGGGYGITLNYGREIGKSFDLSVDLGYQFSDLRPPLKNASATFGRFIISATPALLIQPKKQDAMRFRIGAGPDYYMSCIFNIKGSEVPGGFDDKWKYLNRAGFHVTGIFEMDVSDKWSIDYGIKYYNVSYEFSSGGASYPTDPSLKFPSGSGLDLTVGFLYRF